MYINIYIYIYKRYITHTQHTYNTHKHKHTHKHIHIYIEREGIKHGYRASKNKNFPTSFGRGLLQGNFLKF